MRIIVLVRVPMAGEHHRLGYREIDRSFTGDNFTHDIDELGILHIYEDKARVASYAVDSWSSVQVAREAVTLPRTEAQIEKHNEIQQSAFEEGYLAGTQRPPHPDQEG